MENLFLTQKIKEIENLKANILETFATVQRGTALGAPVNDIARHLARVVNDAYLLGEKLGIGYGALDVFAAENLKTEKSDEAVRLYRPISQRLGRDT